MYQSWDQSAARIRGDETARARASALSTPGHDCLGRYQSDAEGKAVLLLLVFFYLDHLQVFDDNIGAALT
jgi:hypothetical protein